MGVRWIMEGQYTGLNIPRWAGDSENREGKVYSEHRVGKVCSERRVVKVHSENRVGKVYSEV